MRIARNHKQMSTHMPLLMRAIQETDGDVCELGCGFNSTPLLHWFTQGRKLVTYENDPDYYHYAKKFQSSNHRVRGFDEIDFDKHWSVVFIDHDNKPKGSRGDDALKFKNADLIVMHDTEKPEEYGYEKVFPAFKYRYDWKECTPWASIVSNTIDVTKWNHAD